MKGDQFNLNLGWRDTMEDASICNCNLGDGNALFAVFDGHLGKFYFIIRIRSQLICQTNIC